MKPKAPRWLTESFRDGVDERESYLFEPYGEESLPSCWLAQFDKAGKPCEGKFERFHFLSRQRVEGALGGLLPIAIELAVSPQELWKRADERPDMPIPTRRVDWTDFILLAAWDPRNGGIGCEGHHRRLDSHLVPLPSEQLVVPYEALPEHVLEFGSDYGLEHELEAKFEPERQAA